MRIIQMIKWGSFTVFIVLAFSAFIQLILDQITTSQLGTRLFFASLSFLCGFALEVIPFFAKENQPNY